MKFININEASEILGMHPQTVRKLAKKGSLPCRRPGLGTKRPRYKFLTKEIYEWMEEGMPFVDVTDNTVREAS